MKQGWVYILRLENNRRYVGWTANPKDRLRQHFYRPQTKWVAENKPIEVAHQFYGSKKDENIATVQLGLVFGIANVRGGYYNVADMPYMQERVPKPSKLVIGDEFWLDAIYDDRYLASQVSSRIHHL
jgi:hypothetical protein